MQFEQPESTYRVLCARVSHDAYRWIAQLAEEQDVSISHMARRMLTYASQTMPRDWKPTREQG